MILFLVIAVAVAVALAGWWRGLFLCVAAAFVQPPLRKLMPDEPVYFVLLSGVDCAAVAVVAYSRRVPLFSGAAYGWSRSLGTPFALFAALVPLQCPHTLVRYGNPVQASLGAIAWLAPIPAILVGYQFAVRYPAEMGRLLRYYAILTVAVSTGVLLEYAGFDWAVVSAVAGVVGFISVVGLMEPGSSEGLYVERGKTVWEAIPDRLERLGVAPVSWALERHGVLGAGAGTATQGAQHFGGGAIVYSAFIDAQTAPLRIPICTWPGPARIMPRKRRRLLTGRI